MAVNVHGGAGFPVAQGGRYCAYIRTGCNLQGCLCVPQSVEGNHGQLVHFGFIGVVVVENTMLSAL